MNRPFRARCGKQQAGHPFRRSVFILPPIHLHVRAERLSPACAYGCIGGKQRPYRGGGSPVSACMCKVCRRCVSEPGSGCFLRVANHALLGTRSDLRIPLFSFTNVFIDKNKSLSLLRIQTGFGFQVSRDKISVGRDEKGIGCKSRTDPLL